MEGDRSVFTEVLEERGPGYHHVMLRMDFDKGFAQLSEQGYKVALESTTPLGERCALFDTREANGGFIEVMDLHIAFGQVTERSEEHTSELQSLMRISNAVFCLKKKKINNKLHDHKQSPDL